MNSTTNQSPAETRRKKNREIANSTRERKRDRIQHTKQHVAELEKRRLLLQEAIRIVREENEAMRIEIEQAEQSFHAIQESMEQELTDPSMSFKLIHPDEEL
eukprot:TRINITY_DN9823_c0_g2_i2.p2 TRINITY_DN9823_c0_g2~~TRINITY_DN9823_c0_g2_i2.p2  ORF type:complete len:102 (+),score=21.94 TRINITY_DN9823_c0_g2_i2:108-413(+)